MNKKTVRHRSEFFNKFVIKNNYAIMYIESNKYGIKEVIVDIDKIPLLSQIFWHVCKQYDNNRIANLRCVGTSENMLNRNVQTNSHSKHKGIRYRKDCNKFQARIMVNKKAISIGHFKTLLEAIIARQEFCQKNNIIA